MLGKKKKNTFKRKPEKSIKIKKTEKEESIDSAIVSMESSSEEDNNEKINPPKTSISTNKIESYDEKKLRIAKTILNKIDDDIKEENIIDSDEEEKIKENKILELYNEEKKIKSINFFSSPSFSPHESMFIKGHKGTITDLCPSKDGTHILSCSKDTRAAIFDVVKKEKILIKKFAKRELYCCAYFKDEKTALFGGKDRILYEVDLTSHSLIHSQTSHSDSITGLIVDSSNERFLTASNDHVVKVWGQGGGKWICLESLYGHTGKVNCLSAVPGDKSKYITNGEEGYIHLWKVDRMSFLQFNLNDMYPIDCITCLDKDIFFAGGFNGTIHTYSTQKKKPINSIYYAHGYKYNASTLDIGEPILSLCSVPFSDLLISGSTKGVLNFYEFSSDVKFPKKKKKIQLSQKGCINTIKYSEKGKYICCGSGCDNKMGRWDCEGEGKVGVYVVEMYI